MPTPLPPKGTVLQTAEFADSLYSPIFRGAGCALTIPTGALVRLSARVVALYRGCPSLCFYYSTLLAICQALFFGYRSDFGDKLRWVKRPAHHQEKCQVLYFPEKILGENLVVFCRVSFPYPHSACLVAKRDAIPIVALHLRPGVFEEFSLSLYLYYI